MTEGRRIGHVWRLALAIVAVALLGPAPAASAGQALYVSGAASDDVAAFRIAPDGSLSPVAGSPFAAGDGAAGVAITPDARHLYVSNGAGESVSAFGVEAGGALAVLPESPFATGQRPVDLAGTPDGRLLYVGNFLSDTVSAFTVAPGSGALASLGGSPFATGRGPAGVAVSPDGRYAYVANGVSGGISAFHVDPAGGALRPVAGSPFAAAGGPADLALSPDGRRLYAAAFTAGVHAFDVAPATGALSPVAGSPFAAGDGTRSVALSPDGRLLYAANRLSGDVSAYAVAAGGSLSPVAGSPFEAGDGPAGISLTPDGRHLYVSNGVSNDISAFRVARADGSLSPLAGSPYAAGVRNPGSESLAVSPNQAPVAEFSFEPAAPQKPTSFDASASHDPDGEIVRYDWDFGDGGKLPDGGATPRYVYRSFDTYTISLTVTDDGGCSTTLVSTGETLHCNGGAQGATQRAIELEEPRLELRVKRVQRLRRAIKVVGSCDKACTLNARGTLIVMTPARKRARRGGPRRRLRSPKRRAFTLRPARARVAPGEPGVLRLRFRPRSRRAAARALRRGGAVKANLTTDAADELGITVRRPQTRLVKLKARTRAKRAKRKRAAAKQRRCERRRRC